MTAHSGECTGPFSDAWDYPVHRPKPSPAPSLAPADLIALRELVAEIWSTHADPHSGDYNQCDTDPCQWCVETKQRLDALLLTGGREGDRPPAGSS